MMTMLMMERIIATSTHKTQDVVSQDKERSLQSEPQIFLQPKRICDDSRDAEMCEEKSDEDVDVENDDALCPVDLTRRQDGFANSYESYTPKTDSNSEFTIKDDLKRAESVCSDQSRSRSPVRTERSPSAVTVQNRRLAFSVENILDPNKFTGRQSLCGDDICCWKPMESGRRSPDFDGSDTGRLV